MICSLISLLYSFHSNLPSHYLYPFFNTMVSIIVLMISLFSFGKHIFFDTILATYISECLHRLIIFCSVYPLYTRHVNILVVLCFLDFSSMFALDFHSVLYSRGLQNVSPPIQVALGIFHALDPSRLGNTEHSFIPYVTLCRWLGGLFVLIFRHPLWALQE